jgi:hypothetical protein
MIGRRRRHGCTGAAAALQLVQNGAPFVRILANRRTSLRSSPSLSGEVQQCKLRFGWWAYQRGVALDFPGAEGQPITPPLVDEKLTNNSNKTRH